MTIPNEDSTPVDQKGDRGLLSKLERSEISIADSICSNLERMDALKHGTNVPPIQVGHLIVWYKFFIPHVLFTLLELIGRLYRLTFVSLYNPFYFTQMIKRKLGEMLGEQIKWGGHVKCNNVVTLHDIGSMKPERGTLNGSPPFSYKNDGEDKK